MSCIEESINGGEEYNIDLITTFDSFGETDEEGSISDNKVKEFRVLIFDPAGNYKYNVYVADIAGHIPLRLSLEGGTYDFVFIANEGSDPSLSSKLSEFGPGKTLSDLIALRFASSAFDREKNIPMSHIQRNVEVSGRKYTIEGVEYLNTTPWVVPLERLAIRIDLHIKTASFLKQQSFTGVEIFNIPKAVPILEKDIEGNILYNGGAGNYEETARFFDVSIAGNNGFQKVGDEYEWFLKDVILPSNLFTPDSGEDAIKFRATYSNRDPEIAVLDAKGSLRYQAPRNTVFVVDATIHASSLELQVKVENWEEFLYNAGLVPKVDLNVSDINLHLTEYNRGRVLFTSNQPKVYIEELTTTGESVDNIFYGLVGENAYNFYYEYNEATGRGNGYFDLTVDRFKELLENERQKSVVMTLNASGVKRTISVDITIAPAVFAKYDYVGAFWRNDQMGERLITMKNTQATGYWTAQVVAGQDWIVIDEKKSIDPNLFTDNPGDAELYPVHSASTSLSGYGHIFFRIGLTSVNPDSSPRYGLIAVNKNGELVYVYVRQGEGDDYLMRPEDTNGRGDWLGTSGSSVPRPLAVKFTPFNLTAPAYLDGTHTGAASINGFPQLAYEGGKFTQYPTQAGAFFTFASESYPRLAIHPFNSLAISNWDQKADNVRWTSIKSIHETCPPGYRRMRNGNDNSNTTSSPNVNISELKQSIWLNPVNGNMTKIIDNSAFGYYADGFFDRRLIEDAGGLNAHLDDAAVATSSNEIAYAGRLFYNPYNHASLFFPAAGERLSVTTSQPTRYGALMYAGFRGFYWSSTSGSTSAHFLTVSNNTHSESAGTGFMTRANGHSIRCVKDED